MATKRTLQERIHDADERCNRHLADANAALEKGNTVLAEILFEKSGFWRDRFNKLSGNA